MVATFGVHQPPDVWASSRGLDTTQFYPGYLNAFKGTDGKTYGYPKDGNTLAMAYNTDMLTAAGVQPPTTYDEMTSVGAAMKAKGQIAYSLSPSLDRILAFIYGDGGALLSADKKSDVVGQPGFKEALTFYLNLFKQ